MERIPFQVRHGIGKAIFSTLAPAAMIIDGVRRMCHARLQPGRLRICCVVFCSASLIALSYGLWFCRAARAFWRAAVSVEYADLQSYSLEVQLSGPLHSLILTLVRLLGSCASVVLAIALRLLHVVVGVFCSDPLVCILTGLVWSQCPWFD